MDYSDVKSSNGYRMDYTSAGQIAMKLDQADNTADKKISASIWNSFAQEHGLATIKDGEEMDIKKAWSLITKALVRAGNGVSATIENYAKAWLENAPSPTGTVVDGEPAATPPAASEAEATGGSQGTSPANTRTQAEKDAAEVAVTVPKISKEAQEVTKNQKSGKALQASLKQGNLKGIHANNVAYALEDTIFGPNTQKQAKFVFDAIVKRMQNLGIFEHGKHYMHWDAVTRNLNYKKRNVLIREYANLIIEKENEIIRNSNYTAKHRNAIQQTFDEANKFLAEVANMSDKPTKTIGLDNFGDYKQVQLDNGRWIRAYYDKSDEITSIAISYDTTLKTDLDGTKSDYAEVHYTKDKAWYDNDKSNSNWEGYITSGYKFEKLKALVQKIFN